MFRTGTAAELHIFLILLLKDDLIALVNDLEVDENQKQKTFDSYIDEFF